MIELVRPTSLFAEAWWELVDEFGAELIHGSAYRSDDRAELERPGALEAWVDLLASYEAMHRAVQWARERKGPALVHAKVIRPYSHSLSDDETLYRPAEERDADAQRDPITTFPRWLVAQGHATQAELDAIVAEVEAHVLDHEREP